MTNKTPLLLRTYGLICALLFAAGTASALPDLTITSILMPDATGPSVSWSVTVRNQGDESTSSTIFLRLSIVNTGFIQDFITVGHSGSLAPGESYTFTGSKDLSGIRNNGIDKYYDVRGEVDPDNSIDESAEDNNSIDFSRITLVGDGAVAPSISSFTPTSGVVGSSVTVNGNNFGETRGTSNITFGGVTATITSWSNTAITVTVPSLSLGGYVLSVITANGTGNSSSNFTVIAPSGGSPSVTSFSPLAGFIGSSVILTGTNFGATKGASYVRFTWNNDTTNGFIAATTSWTDASVTVTVPQCFDGFHHITVFTSGGTGKSVSIFLVKLAAPIVTSFTPTSGPTGTTVTFLGSSFGMIKNTKQLWFNGNSVVTPIWTDSKVTGIVPTLPLGNAEVDLYTLAGHFISTFTVTSTTDVKTGKIDKVAETFALGQNYPNPFNPSTRVTYTVPAPAHVRITILNTLGEVVSVLADCMQSAGVKDLMWKADASTPSGVYFCRLNAASISDPAIHFNETRKMLLVK